MTETELAERGMTEAELAEIDQIFEAFGVYPDNAKCLARGHLPRACIHCLRDKLGMKRRDERMKAEQQAEYERNRPPVPKPGVILDGPGAGTTIPGTLIDQFGFCYHQNEIYRQTPDGLRHVPRKPITKTKEKK